MENNDGGWKDSTMSQRYMMRDVGVMLMVGTFVDVMLNKEGAGLAKTSMT